MYDRIIKNLQSLRQKDLLRFKDYGLGKDNLWALKSGKALRLAEEAINQESEEEIKITPPRAEIHSFKYEHEKTCADVFVTLLLSGKLCGWEAHKKIAEGIIPDRIAELDRLAYIEVEMGSKNEIREKAERYRKFYYDSRKRFEVWFLVGTDKLYESGLEDLRDFSGHYRLQKLSDMRSDTQSD